MIVDLSTEPPRASSALVWRCWPALGWLVSGLLMACTLTSGDFEPSPAQRSEALAPEAGARPPEPPGLCGGAVECCEAVPCVGERVCRNGACEAPRADSGAPPCLGVDCASPAIPVLAPSCQDGQLNQGEADVDCGGGCERTCAADQRCRADVDCSAGLFCSPEGERCRAISCSDGVRNGGEVLADCGGGQCDGCPDGTSCGAATDCQSGVCSGGRCASPTCNDGVRNQGEADVDCGGACGVACPSGGACSESLDCQSGVCQPGGCAAGVSTCCQAPSCEDGVTNGTEPVTDCGNFTCGPCEAGRSCNLGFQCQSGLCQLGRCVNAPSCSDALRNGTETGVDCGGGVCPVCPDLSPCNQPADCFNNNCDPNGICISCGDGTINGSETDLDCGGSDPFCQRCGPGQRCQSNTDCASSFCLGGVCT